MLCYVIVRHDRYILWFLSWKCMTDRRTDGQDRCNSLLNTVMYKTKRLVFSNTVSFSRRSRAALLYFRKWVICTTFKCYWVVKPLFLMVSLVRPPRVKLSSVWVTICLLMDPRVARFLVGYNVDGPKALTQLPHALHLLLLHILT